MIRKAHREDAAGGARLSSLSGAARFRAATRKLIAAQRLTGLLGPVVPGPPGSSRPEPARAPPSQLVRASSRPSMARRSSRKVTKEEMERNKKRTKARRRKTKDQL